MNAIEALKIVRDRAQSMREDGDSDLRSILWLISGLIKNIQAGKTTEEIIAEYAGDETKE
jgi:hypothetical protein